MGETEVGADDEQYNDNYVPPAQPEVPPRFEAQPQQEQQRQHDHAGGCYHIARGDIRQQRATGEEDVRDGDDGHVEEVAAHHVGHGHVRGAHAHGGEGYRQLRQGGGEGQEEAAHEALPQAGDAGDLVTDGRQPDAGPDDKNRRYAEVEIDPV